jgi:hypothetical protein
MTVRISNLASLFLASLPIIAILGIAQMETAARAVGL